MYVFLCACTCLGECACVQAALCVSLTQHVSLRRSQVDIVCLSQLLSTYFIFRTSSLIEPGHTDLSKLAGQWALGSVNWIWLMLLAMKYYSFAYQKYLGEFRFLLLRTTTQCVCCRKILGHLFQFINKIKLLKENYWFKELLDFNEDRYYQTIINSL